MRRLATSGLGAGGDSDKGGGGGGRAPGGLGADGGFGADATGGFGGEPSSERYGESLFAPVSTPPRLRNLGIPPANRPPSCAAGALGALSTPEPPPPLLLRSRFPVDPEGGTGGVPVGGRAIVGTGGAPTTGGPDVFPPSFPRTGADLSLVTVFFN